MSLAAGFPLLIFRSFFHYDQKTKVCKGGPNRWWWKGIYTSSCKISHRDIIYSMENMTNNNVITLHRDRWLLDLQWLFHYVCKCQITMWYTETIIILYVYYISIKAEGRKGGRKETERKCEERMHTEGQKDKVHLVMAIMTDNRRILRARWKKRSLPGSSIQATLNTNSRLLKDEQKISSQPLTTKAFRCSCCSLWQDSTTHTPFQGDCNKIPDHQILTKLR